MRQFPTPYPEINQVLLSLRDNAKEILGDQFIGMYLYGSLSSGDFDIESSDIDFVFITKDSLTKVMIEQLEGVHKRTWATSLKWAGKLEGAYVPMELIRKYDPIGAPCPTVNERKFYVAPLGSDWIIQRHVIREYGVVVEGPDPKTLIDHVSHDDIRASVLGTLNEWWFPMLDNPTWLQERDSQYRSYTVITMCRALHALEHGTIVSKPKATQWAVEYFGDTWKPLIDLAMHVRNYADQDVPLEETLNFMRLVKDRTK